MIGFHCYFDQIINAGRRNAIEKGTKTIDKETEEERVQEVERKKRKTIETISFAN